MNDGVLVIMYESDDGVTSFKVERNDENPTFKLLMRKLSEARFIPLPFNGDGYVHWLFSNPQQQESFIEAFKWFIIHE